jgi:hypothetical protein
LRGWPADRGSVDPTRGYTCSAEPLVRSRWCRR